MSSEKSPYSTKIWLKSYDKNVKPEIDINIISLVDAMKNSVNNFPNRILYDFLGHTATYKEVESAVISFANFLVQNGVKKGDRVVIHLPNSPQYIISLLGTFYAGCITSGMNFLLQPNEIIYQLADSGASVLITLDSFYEEKVFKALSTKRTPIKIIVTTNIADTLNLNPIVKFLGKKLKKIPFGEVASIEGIKYFTFNEILQKYPKDKLPGIKLDPKNDIAFLQYTGGTTGAPKGAILTHANIVSNISQILHWIERDIKIGDEIFITGFPFFHLAGMFFNLAAIFFASTQILIPDPRDTKLIIKGIKKYSPTVMANVPTLYLMLLSNPDFKKLNFNSIKLFVSGAAPFPSENIRQFEEVVGKRKVGEVYGMTEASPLVTVNPYLGNRKIGTVGIPLPNTELRIVDVENKTRDMPLGEAGEIIVKGPQIFKGYWNKPEETKNALKDGWFYTGDVGIMDEDGFLTIVDRTKDMIIVSGYKVFSVEIDDKLSKHPAIELCSTVGVSDPNKPGSEIVKLFVKLKVGYKNTPEMKEDILKYAKENLAAYKVPKIIEISDDIPLTAVGKIDKKILRAQEKGKIKQ